MLAWVHKTLRAKSILGRAKQTDSRDAKENCAAFAKREPLNFQFSVVRLVNSVGRNGPEILDFRQKNSADRPEAIGA
jgi:hypothetical protein